jgi:hypothetical protein
VPQEPCLGHAEAKYPALLTSEYKPTGLSLTIVADKTVVSGKMLKMKYSLPGRHATMAANANGFFALDAIDE